MAEKPKKKDMTIHEKLIRIQQTLHVKKGRYNKFGEYYYRSLEDVMEGLKPVLAAVGCSVTFNDELLMTGDRYYIKAVITLSDDTDRITATAFAREELAKKKQDGSQLTGGASSYARKYAAGALFLIDDAADSDATNKHGKDEKTNTKSSAEKNKKADAKEPKGITKAAKTKLVEQEAFNFGTVWAEEIPEGYEYSKEKFTDLLRARFKALKPEIADVFNWTAEGVHKYAETVMNISECLVELVKEE